MIINLKLSQFMISINKKLYNTSSAQLSKQKILKAYKRQPRSGVGLETSAEGVAVVSLQLKQCLKPCLHVQAVESCGRAAEAAASARPSPLCGRRRRAVPAAASAPRPPLVVGAKPYAL